MSSRSTRKLGSLTSHAQHSLPSLWDSSSHEPVPQKWTTYYELPTQNAVHRMWLFYTMMQEGSSKLIRVVSSETGIAQQEVSIIETRRYEDWITNLSLARIIFQTNVEKLVVLLLRRHAREWRYNDENSWYGEVSLPVNRPHHALRRLRTWRDYSTYYIPYPELSLNDHKYLRILISRSRKALGFPEARFKRQNIPLGIMNACESCRRQGSATLRLEFWLEKEALDQISLW